MHLRLSLAHGWLHFKTEGSIRISYAHGLRG
jgi:hypothetical protein